MLGVQLLGNQKVVVKDFPDPQPSGSDILIEIRSSGICGSELGAFRGPETRPFNGGHEVSGVVLEPGRSGRFTTGDRVGVHAIWGCGSCHWCQDGKYTYCDQRSTCPGTHAERIAAPDHVCLKIPDDIPFDVGVLLTGDGMGVPYRVSRRLQTQVGQTVCIVGAGPVGLGNTIVQSFLGAQVIVIDVNAYRLSLARDCGAAHTVNSKDVDPVEAVMSITSGLLADKCIEAGGRPAALKLALCLVGKAGTVVATGEQGEVPISPSEDLIRRDITLMGSWFYHYSDYPAMLDLYRQGLPIDRMITDHFPMSQAQDAFNKFARGEAGKVMLEP